MTVSPPEFTDRHVPSQKGRTFVVTGANSGVGFEASKALAARDAEVVMACRDEEKARRAMARIADEVPGAKLDFVPLDQADLFDVRRAADLLASRPRIDVLINNAGVMMPPLSHSAQGHELQFGVNHLAPFALTALLLPKLAETEGARVVVTASLAHRGGGADWSDPKAERSYSPRRRYQDSKLANALFFFELDRRLRAAGLPVAAIGCHPGVSLTNLWRHLGMAGQVARLGKGLLNSERQAAWPTLQAATDPLARGGDYYGPQAMGEMRGPSGIARRSREARDPRLAARLWDLSADLAGIDPGLPPA